jgi:hypothetical protein
MPIEWGIISVLIAATNLLYRVLMDEQSYRREVNEEMHKAVTAFITALRATKDYVATHNKDNSDPIEEMKISSLWHVAADYLFHSAPILGDEAKMHADLLHQKAKHWLSEDPWSNEQLAKTEHLDLTTVETKLAELQSVFTSRSPN